MAVTSRGSPQPLFSRFTNEPHCINPDFKRPFHNAYYPSPEMHEDAADALEPAVRRMAGCGAYPGAHIAAPSGPPAPVRG